ncbi:hypothetical protein [Amycolatopsis sp. NPDC051372]|uniref:hypothetical protein n=1 Tax=Amycolatopsis sp. NPDC051372 TaxID=3155669 RepID=UPI003438214B
MPPSRASSKIAGLRRRRTKIQEREQVGDDHAERRYLESPSNEKASRLRGTFRGSVRRLFVPCAVIGPGRRHKVDAEVLDVGAVAFSIVVRDRVAQPKMLIGWVIEVVRPWTAVEVLAMSIQVLPVLHSRPPISWQGPLPANARKLRRSSADAERPP